jgi:hypothetical protein
MRHARQSRDGEEEEEEEQQPEKEVEAVKGGGRKGQVQWLLSAWIDATYCCSHTQLLEVPTNCAIGRRRAPASSDI